MRALACGLVFSSEIILSCRTNGIELVYFLSVSDERPIGAEDPYKTIRNEGPIIKQLHHQLEWIENNLSQISAPITTN